VSARLVAGGVLAGLVASAIALGAAPLLMLPAYSWMQHTVSESAAQGVSGAWLVRLGFLLFGFPVLSLAALAIPISGRIRAAVSIQIWSPEVGTIE
jgi:hypothetical protein